MKQKSTVKIRNSCLLEKKKKKKKKQTTRPLRPTDGGAEAYTPVYRYDYAPLRARAIDLVVAHAATSQVLPL